LDCTAYSAVTNAAGVATLTLTDPPAGTFTLSAASVADALNHAATSNQIANYTITASTTQAPTPPTVEPESGTTRFMPVTPARLVDTRSSECGYLPVAECIVTVPVAGQHGVPVDAVAAALTLTVPNASEGGWAAIWPTGTPWPGISNVNFNQGDDRANGAIVQLGANGAVNISSTECGDLIVDVTGAFLPADSATEGRFVSVGPDRVFDSGLADVARETTTTLSPSSLRVPADATAVAINITVDRSQAGGYVTAFPAGTTQPYVSMLNTNAAGQTRAATALIPLSADGISFWQNIGGRFIVDVTGYFTGTSADDSTDGLYTPITPTRIMDTRQAGGGGPIADGEWRRLNGIPANAAAIAANWTIDNASGWLAAAPTGNWNGTSTVNGGGPATATANLGLIPVGANGISIRAGDTTTGASTIVDLAGYFS
jgi:hypothetical protein